MCSLRRLLGIRLNVEKNPGFSAEKGRRPAEGANYGILVLREAEGEVCREGGPLPGHCDEGGEGGVELVRIVVHL